MFESLAHKNFLFFPDQQLAGGDGVTKKQKVDQTFENLTSNIRDLEILNSELREARRAAFNLLEDAVQTKEALRNSEQKYRTKLEQEVLDRTAELKKSQHQYVSLVENTPDVITRWNKLLKLVYANTAFADKTGKRLKDLYGKTNLEMGQPDDIAIPYMNSLRKVFETGEPVEHFNSFPTADGEVFYASRIVPEKNENGNVETVLSIARDISDIRKAEQEVLRLKDEIARQAEDKYRKLFNTMTEAFIICEMRYNDHGQAVDWRWLEVNPAFEKLIGITSERLIGKMRTEVLPMDESLLEKYAEVVRTQEPDEFEHNSVEAGKWLHVRAVPFGNRQFAVLFGDISERKQHEQRQQDEINASRQLQKVSSSLIDSNNIDELYQKIMNASKSIVHSQAASIQRFVQEKDSLHLIAWQGFHPEAAKFWEWVDVESGSTCGAALANNQRIIVPDIETCDFMKGTRDLEAYRLSGIRSVQSTPLISRSGKIVGMLSNHWTNVHEPSENELNFLDVLARQAADIIERKRAEKALVESEGQLRNLNLTLEHQVTARTKELVESGKQIVALNRTLFEMNRELNSLNSELKTFTGVAASHYSETLRHLYINLEMIITNDARNLSNSGRANLRRAQGAIQKMKLVTEDLISFSKLHDIGSKEHKVDLNKILKTVVDELTNRPNQPPIEIHCDHLPLISGYPSLLSLLFHHLLDNAIKFRREDEHHVISVRCQDLVKGEELNIKNAETNNTYMVVTVSDNGIGFPPEESENIFEMFYRLHDKGYKGSGIGLAICKKVMEMHGGFITADGTPNGGGNFHCYFPNNE